MEKLVQTLYEKMHSALSEIATSSDNELQQAQRSCQMLQQLLEDLKDYITAYEFKSEEEEIHFFKNVKPMFQQELIYHTELYYFELNYPIGSENEEERYIFRSLQMIRHLFERERFLYSYHRTRRTDLDEDFFLRNTSAKPSPFLAEYSPDNDTRFSTIQSTQLAQLKAFERLRDHLNYRLSILKSPQQNPFIQQNNLSWTDTKAGLIELIYALQSVGALNHSKAEVKQVAGFFEQVFHIDLGNYYRTFQEIRIRKKGRTAFLDKMKEMLVKRMDETDEYIR